MKTLAEGIVTIPVMGRVMANIGTALRTGVLARHRN